METKATRADTHFMEPKGFSTGEESALSLKQQNYENKIGYRVNTYLESEKNHLIIVFYPT